MNTPRIIRLRLNQIDLPSPFRPWCVGLRHLPNCIPTMRKEALAILPLLQPLVVRAQPRSESSSPHRYAVVAGRRTLQLLLEQFPRDHRTWALCVQRDEALPEEDDLELLDTLLTKLICRPDNDDLALIATALKTDEVLRSKAKRYVDVATDAAIGRLVGMSRTAMHRHVENNRAKFRKQPEAAAGVVLDLLQAADRDAVIDDGNDQGDAA
jgi:hypothetical protein